jgi:hypothetical protein
MKTEELISITGQVLDELKHAQLMYPPFNSRHEGYAIILEELDELWDLIKLNHSKSPECREQMKKEAIQTAAMCLRFIVDCCQEKPKEAW